MSTEAKHTPGPWTVVDYASKKKGFIAVVTAELTAHICDVFPFGGRRGGAERELQQHLANARLIAAAPDLDAAAGSAITALAFEQERAHKNGDTLAHAQITAAKEGLIAAQDKVRGRNPKIIDVTPHRAALAKADGRS